MAGLAGAELATIANEAAISAARRGSQLLLRDDFLVSIFISAVNTDSGIPARVQRAHFKAVCSVLLLLLLLTLFSLAGDDLVTLARVRVSSLVFLSPHVMCRKRGTSAGGVRLLLPPCIMRVALYFIYFFVLYINFQTASRLKTFNQPAKKSRFAPLCYLVRPSLGTGGRTPLPGRMLPQQVFPVERGVADYKAVHTHQGRERQDKSARFGINYAAASRTAAGGPPSPPPPV